MEWSDRKKWGMGIVASLILASVVGLVSMLFFAWNNPNKLKRFPAGVELLSIPKQSTNTGLRIEAVHQPKNWKKAKRRFYDIYLSNQLDQPITVIAVIVDTHFKSSIEKLSGEGDAIYPDVTYKFTYNPHKENQLFPLDRPFRIKPRGVGAMRLQFDAAQNYYFSAGSMAFKARLRTSDGKEYAFVE